MTYFNTSKSLDASPNPGEIGPYKQAPSQVYNLVRIRRCAYTSRYNIQKIIHYNKYQKWKSNVLVLTNSELNQWFYITYTNTLFCYRFYEFNIKINRMRGQKVSAIKYQCIPSQLHEVFYKILYPDFPARIISYFYAKFSTQNIHKTLLPIYTSHFRLANIYNPSKIF